MIVNIYRERKNQLFDAFSRKLMIKTDQNRYLRLLRRIDLLMSSLAESPKRFTE